MTASRRYRGRFAPSPTGPLHMGSLLAALTSYLDARAHDGEWLLRIEDIDPPREARGSTAAILRSLVLHGLRWDGELLFQSARVDAYAEALARLEAAGLVFRCSCTRTTLGPNGSCGERCTPRPGHPFSLRMRLDPEPIRFDDGILGPRTQAPIARDLVLKRKDGLFAYALAVVADDGWQGITDVVRGMDLLEQTPAQLCLLEKLGYPLPRYTHLPLLCNDAGEKLSKQNGAPAVDDRQPLANLRQALRLLGQHSADAPAGSPRELLRIASGSWSRAPLIRGGGAALVYGAVETP